MDPFARFRKNKRSRSVRKLPEQIVRGNAYTATNFERKISDYKAKDGSTVYNLLAYFNEDNINFYKYMGTDFNIPTEEEVNGFNDLISSGKAPKIVFYGSPRKLKVLDILQHDKVIDASQLATCSETEEVSKRSSTLNMSDSPAKKPQTDF